MVDNEQLRNKLVQYIIKAVAFDAALRSMQQPRLATIANQEGVDPLLIMLVERVEDGRHLAVESMLEVWEMGFAPTDIAEMKEWVLSQNIDNGNNQPPAKDDGAGE